MNMQNKMKLVKLVNNNYPLRLSEQELYKPDRRKATAIKQPLNYRIYCKLAKTLGFILGLR